MFFSCKSVALHSTQIQEDSRKRQLQPWRKLFRTKAVYYAPCNFRGGVPKYSVPHLHWPYNDQNQARYISFNARNTRKFLHMHFMDNIEIAFEKDFIPDSPWIVKQTLMKGRKPFSPWPFPLSFPYLASNKIQSVDQRRQTSSNPVYGPIWCQKSGV